MKSLPEYWIFLFVTFNLKLNENCFSNAIGINSDDYKSHEKFVKKKINEFDHKSFQRFLKEILFKLRHPSINYDD